MSNKLLLSIIMAFAPASVLAAGFAGSYKPVGVCIEVPIKTNAGEMPSNPLSVRSYAANLVSYHADERFTFDYENGKVTLLRAPKHGTLSKDWSNGIDVFYGPHHGYSGEDSAEFLVDIEGHVLTVRYRLVVDISKNTKGNHTRRCPDQNWWEIQ